MLPQAAKLDFENFSVDQGLSSPMVQCIFQDRRGFLWFCTWNGLYRYDGYSFVSYKHDPSDTSSINNSYASTIYEDKVGILWIGTWHGLEKFDYSTGSFIHYTLDPSGSGSDLSNSIWAICEDKYGMLWIGTSNGLNKFDRSTGKFTCLRYDSTDPGSINHNSIHSIYEDETGSLWFGTGGGLDKLDFTTSKFQHYWNDSSNRRKIWVNNSKYWINAIYGDNNGTIWLGTNRGLVEFNQKSGTFNDYLPNPNEQQILRDNWITSICQDASGILWLGTRNLLYAFDIKSKEFIGYDFYDVNEPGSVTYNEIYSVCVERSGTLWVGTYNGGANKFKLKVNSFKKYLSDRYVYGIIEDKETLIILTSKGWIKFNPTSEKINPYSFGIDKPLLKDSGDLWIKDFRGYLYKRDIQGNIRYFYDLSGNRFNKQISCIYKTSKGFWIGTEQAGLYVLDPAKNHIREVYKSNLSITNIFEDSFGLVWVSTFMGKLLCFNQKQAIINEFISDPKISGNISGRQIRDIHEDKKGRLWFATNVGLNIYNRLTKKFTHFDEKDGLLDNNTYNIL
ncbi:MAG: two-component regulator propeller domain-containing protein, partial [Ignavibacteria bacterium]